MNEKYPIKVDLGKEWPPQVTPGPGTMVIAQNEQGWIWAFARDHKSDGFFSVGAIEPDFTWDRIKANFTILAVFTGRTP